MLRIAEGRRQAHTRNISGYRNTRDRQESRRDIDAGNQRLTHLARPDERGMAHDQRNMNYPGRTMYPYPAIMLRRCRQ